VKRYQFFALIKLKHKKKWLQTGSKAKSASVVNNCDDENCLHSEASANETSEKPGVCILQSIWSSGE
jgi:hypothetical protein